MTNRKEVMTKLAVAVGLIGGLTLSAATPSLAYDEGQTGLAQTGHPQPSAGGYPTNCPRGFAIDSEG